MQKTIRVIIAIALVLGVVLLAKDKVAWAGPGSAADSSASSQVEASAPLAKPEPGSVKPPRPEIQVCKDGIYSVGGEAVLKINRLMPDYCLEAFLHNKAFALGRIPDGAGQVLADVSFLRVFYRGKFTYEVPEGDGSLEICFAVPPGKQAKIYFFDFYGPRFGQRSGQPSWEPLQTTVENGIACAPAQKSGAYALIGK